MPPNPKASKSSDGDEREKALLEKDRKLHEKEKKLI